MKNNPLRILQTLDRHLTAPFELYVYGRSALALGYTDEQGRFQSTMDVDAILPARDIKAIEQNEDFWQAQMKTNEELGSSGLYFTHLFEDRQVILTPDWLDRVVELSAFHFTMLRLFRPSTIDLILTKMMRVDPDDREDIKFLARQPDFRKEELQSALKCAIVPPVPELQEAFEKNWLWLSQLIGV